MTAPEPTQDLAERVARASQDSSADPDPGFDDLDGEAQRYLIALAEQWLAAAQAAGLTVVELPEAQPSPGGHAGWAADFGPVIAHVDDDGSVDIRAYIAGKNGIADAEIVGAALIAAGRWPRARAVCPGDSSRAAHQIRRR